MLAGANLRYPSSDRDETLVSCYISLWAGYRLKKTLIGLIEKKLRAFVTRSSGCVRFVNG